MVDVEATVKWVEGSYGAQYRENSIKKIFICRQITSGGSLAILDISFEKFGWYKMSELKQKFKNKEQKP